LACVADPFPDDDLLDNASLDDLDAGFFGAVCASAAHVASRTIIAKRITDDLKIRFENIAPPLGMKLISLVVGGSGRKSAIVKTSIWK
jgi:hypothetical protein